MMKVSSILVCILLLQGCITSVVTFPVKVAYKTTKGVVKGTAAVVDAAIPDSDNKKSKD
ncbi:NF038104 family lipoprotein [Acinetobacter sp. B5B]|uniref:NF038104 family lipoprotein n=1 Tax=Acinetobacter baretiae TaxID=2605383 RepID=UPI0018C28AE3|nr:NF038104 family lipoprotein [Acinetobacter baretiae]MBF7682380.1 NF038104 family lipoprotein [Acinetobacter baretiae]MBF7685872.1 NF038104 family lipoprotein [Acinetobacter baretiae]